MASSLLPAAINARMESSSAINGPSVASILPH
jgi:hypothetical protein